MHKDFDGWNKKKKETDVGSPQFYTVREIWWCRLGVNIGTEQDGGGQFLRPVVILRGFGPSACCVAPLTTSSRKHSVRFSVGEIKGKEASANLSQLRVVDTRRLIEKVGFLDRIIFAELRKAVRNLF